MLALVADESVDLVDQLVGCLRSGSVTLETTATRLRLEFVHGPRSLDRILAVLRDWRVSGGSGQLLAHALSTAVQLRRSLENRGPRCELVWTGEAMAGSGIRSTLPVIREMLTWANRSVLVVTYAMWLGEGDASQVITQLSELSSRGVDVTFILDERYQGGWNVAQLRRAWPRGRRGPTVYSWASHEDAIAKLHAKVLLVDRRDLLITSANLTGHGMRQNLEFGLRVSGTPAEDAAAHLEGLIRRGVFEAVAWS